MFSVECALKQLKPDFILSHVLSAEERCWSKVHLAGQDVNGAASMSPTSSMIPDIPEPGTVLLRHGTSVRKIHAYFSQLEFRKCCLHLAGRKSTCQTMRVVHKSGMDDGSVKKERAPYIFVSHLEDKELRAFKHAYLCAAYPVLAAPGPPSPISPSPVSTHNLGSYPLQSATVDGVTSGFGKVTLHDSGLEEAEELAFVPSESICNHLQRAFHLSDEKFRDYRYLINKTYVKKSQSAQKLLAEQLAGQLAVLKNNSHPFYKPQEFLPPHRYETWHETEYNHITELLGKFWPYDLPLPRESLDLFADLHSVHDDYCILLNKLLAFERDSRDQTDDEAQKSTLSSASIRLLREFGLRYGVGELFRRVQYLNQVTTDFSPTVWHVRHVLSILSGISELMPAHRKALAIVRRECDTLQACLLRLSTQAAKALEQMKSFFPNNKPDGGVGLLITLIQRVQEMRGYLQPSLLTEIPSIETFLKTVVQGMFFQTYEKCKTVIRTELKHTRDIHICPRMLNALIMEIRNEVLEYRNCFDAVFSSYFDICVIAAKMFYALLMKDVEMLCQEEILINSAIDLRMLALVHRLNQLDSDWCMYIKPQNQIWRRSFQTHMARWCVTLNLHVEDLVLESIAGDAFMTQQLQIHNDRTSTMSSSSSNAAQSSPFTPSINSAFSSITSIYTQGSLPSSHHHPYSLITPIPLTPSSVATNMSDQISTDQNDPSGSEHTANDFLTFAEKRRPCASMPIFSERPAIVRIMSDNRMVDQVPPSRILHSSGCDDLTQNNDEYPSFSTSNRLKIVSESSSSEDTDREVKKSTWNCEVDHTAAFEEVVMVVGDDSDIVESMEEVFGKEDTDYAYPQVEDVTCINVSASASSTDGRLQQQMRNEAMNTRAIGQRRRKKQAATEGGRAASRAAPLRSISQELEEEQLRKLGTIGQGGRLSCPHPDYRSRLMHTEDLHASKAVLQRLQQVGSMRISASSIGMESEHKFLQSVQSTMSFPSPVPSSEAIIPVSGSSIDLVVLIQRTLGFSQSLCKTIFPVTPRESQEEGAGSMLPDSGDASHMCSPLASYLSSTRVSIVEILCRGISVYVDNMLCMDLCAIQKDVAIKVIGDTLVKHMMAQSRRGRIWGCRHQLEGRASCFAFHNSKATLLADRYEPITHKMCVRVNNVMACQHFLDWFEQQTQPNKFHSSPVVRGTGVASDGRNTLSQFHQRGGDHRVSEKTELDSKLSCVEETATHLMSVWTAQCRLLAWRINLFLRDGLTILLSMKPPDISVAACLQPLTVFLRNHLDALSSWLYSQSFRRVVEYLWVFIVRDIEIEACKLKSENKGPVISPHLLLQALMHLMKFMNNCEKGITSDKLLSQADAVMTELQVFTLPTLKVIALYQRLVEMQYEDETSMSDSSRHDSVPVLVLHQIRRDLQTRQKCFSGAQLVDWIVQHADLFMSPDELSLCKGKASISKQKAITTAQHLLDLELIKDVDDVLFESRTSSINNMEDLQYPEVSLLEVSSNEATPTPTPYPTIDPSRRQLGHTSSTEGKTQGMENNKPKKIGDKVSDKSSSSPTSCDSVRVRTTDSQQASSFSSQRSLGFGQTEGESQNQSVISSSVAAAKTDHGAVSIFLENTELDHHRLVDSNAAVSSKSMDPATTIYTENMEPVSEKGSDLSVTVAKDETGTKKDDYTIAAKATLHFGDSSKGSTEVARHEQTIQDRSIKVIPSTSAQRGSEQRKADLEDSGIAVGIYGSGGGGGGGGSCDAGLSVRAKLIGPIINASKAAMENSFRSDPLKTSHIFKPGPYVSSHVNSLPDLKEMATVLSEGSLLSSRLRPKRGSNASFSSLTDSLNATMTTDTQQQLPANIPGYLVPALRPESAYDLDMTSLSGTPISFMENHATDFSCVNDRFYFMPPSVSPFYPNHLTQRNLHHHLPKVLLSPIECSLQRLKNSDETGSLVEKCFTLKITPVFLLMVLYSRRKTDELAWKVVDQLPLIFQKRVSSGMESQGATECSVL